jgi:hypothetical protein
MTFFIWMIVYVVVAVIVAIVDGVYHKLNEHRDPYDGVDITALLWPIFVPVLLCMFLITWCIVKPYEFICDFIAARIRAW